MTLAPIVLFVYNRPEHTLQTLEALSKNDLANESILYVYADGPQSQATPEALARITATREVISRKRWCREVVLNESKINKGLASSLIGGITEVMAQHEKAIILEDDILTDQSFLAFMNNALEYYSDDAFVAGVSGFTYPHLMETDKVFFLPIGSSWGWGTWKRQWKTVSFDTKLLVSEIKRKHLIKNFNFGGCPFYGMLNQQLEGTIDSWAIRFYASFFLQKRCFAYAPVSLVQNIGFDSSATHTGNDDGFLSRVTIKQGNINFRKPKYDKVTRNVELQFKAKYKPENYYYKAIVNFLKKVKSKFRLFNQGTLY